MALITASLNAGVITGGDSVAIGMYSPFLFPNLHWSVPNKPYGFCGCKAPGKKKKTPQEDTALLHAFNMQTNKTYNEAEIVQVVERPT